jgi:hypothetical protein
MNHESKHQIELEDLLRLKRAERPPAEFWSEFDRQLRAKQLAALVGRRPWWQSMPRVFGGLGRYRLPIGASAVLAVTLITLRDHRTNSTPAAGTAAVREVTATAAVVAAPEISAAPVLASDDVVRLGIESAERSADAATALASDATAPGELARLVPLLGAGEVAQASSSTTVAAAPAAALPKGLLAVAKTFDSGVSSARPTVEPLHQITPPSERGRSRIFTAMISMTPAEAPSRSSDRVIGQLDEERLYDQVRRFGARGAGMRISF